MIKLVKFLMQKVMMTSAINTDGKILPVLILKSQNITCLKKIKNNDSFIVFLGFFDIAQKEYKKFNKSFINGNYQMSDQKKRFIREFKVTQDFFNKFEEGKEVLLKEFIYKDMKINITGITKGRGFTGVMKRYGFAGQPASHGVSLTHRHMGSTGCRKPRRVIKGRKMPGHYGSSQVTVTNAKVVRVDNDNTLIIKGSAPGANGSLLIVSFMC